jgi:hypothetical protein
LRNVVFVQEEEKVKRMWLKVLFVVLACAVLSSTLAALMWYTHHLGLDTLFDVVAVVAFIMALLALGIACYFIIRPQERVVASETTVRAKEVVIV